jgi:hypothetical protein
MTFIDHNGYHICDVHGGARLHDPISGCPTHQLTEALAKALDATPAEFKEDWRGWTLARHLIQLMNDHKKTSNQ